LSFKLSPLATKSRVEHPGAAYQVLNRGDKNRQLVLGALCLRRLREVVHFFLPHRLTAPHPWAWIGITSTLNSKATEKVAGFVLLMLVFLAVANSDLLHGPRMVWWLSWSYVFGGVFAFWVGDDPIGTFRPISLRPLCILIGALFMIWAFSMLLFVKEGLHKSRPAPHAISKPATSGKAGGLTQV
jgi:hypothetical protein